MLFFLYPFINNEFETTVMSDKTMATAASIGDKISRPIKGYKIPPAIGMATTL